MNKSKDMTLDFYQASAARTSKYQEPQTDDICLVDAALSLAGEAGELANLVKKRVFHGESVDAEDLVGELGDALWYLAEFARLMQIPLSGIAEYNLEKLQERWPEGFKRGDRP